MSAIAGIIRLDGISLDPAWLERMQNVLEPYGRDAQHLWHDPQAGLLRTLCRITPEDSLDRQPLHDPAGRLVLVFDGRIDNREELSEKLDLSAAQSRLLADSDFVFRSYERWGDACLDHLLGDFALAVWDSKARRLFLARDPLGHRPLYWYQNSRFFAFATMATGLFALPEVPRALCRERLVDYLALLPMAGPESFYQDIYRIEPGHLLVLDNGEIHTRRYHRFDPGYRITFKNDDDYVEAARDLLHKSVKCRLRSSGKIASELSSGLDSSTVTATAAQLLQEEGKSLLAFTAVPREGFDGPAPQGKHADEGPAAAALAARFANIEHVLFRADDRNPISRLPEQIEGLGRAPQNPCNFVWIDGIRAEAARRGAKVLLTGMNGNMTISYSNKTYLANLVRRGQWWKWLREVRQRVRQGNLRWRGAIFQSVAPFLPVPLWQFLKTRAGYRVLRLKDLSAISPGLIRPALYDRARRAGWNLSWRPTANTWETRTTMLYWIDAGDYFSDCVARSGLERRNPLDDLRLVTYCLAIPDDQYVNGGRNRWLVRRLMSRILPPEILNAKTRGLQAADWYEGATAARDDMRVWIDRLEATSEAPGYLDLNRMRRLLDDWPKDGWDQKNIRYEYRALLLRGLAVGAFIHYVKGGNR